MLAIQGIVRVRPTQAERTHYQSDCSDLQKELVMYKGTKNFESKEAKAFDEL
jgi:hypothetical protein